MVGNVDGTWDGPELGRELGSREGNEVGAVGTLETEGLKLGTPEIEG